MLTKPIRSKVTIGGVKGVSTVFAHPESQNISDDANTEQLAGFVPLGVAFAFLFQFAVITDVCKEKMLGIGLTRTVCATLSVVYLFLF